MEQIYCPHCDSTHLTDYSYCSKTDINPEDKKMYMRAEGAKDNSFFRSYVLYFKTSGNKEIQIARIRDYYLAKKIMGRYNLFLKRDIPINILEEEKRG